MRPQSLVITIHTCSLSVQIIKMIKIRNTPVKYQYYVKSEETQKKISKNIFV
jgi:hypothetical protein